ncbi:type II secretion system protein M [Scandinavium sp. H11S7]|uniref:type II secretion system protein M n=1 Tax=Scandinavium hiltneri TaxID=2926519 RepID=UPI002166A785|nr:type II secretion system protein M [Scandinavium hiltneri]MCS2158437.1 type II secretion system protein M [Scandinavium hiltneri]
MNATLQKMKARWQQYQPRERKLILLCLAVLGVAIFYFGAWQPLVMMNKNSQLTLKRQQETLNWMRHEIESKHIPVRKLKTANVSRLVEISARALKIPLSNMQQQNTALSFGIANIDIYQLRDWLREINLSSGAQVQKLTLTPVDSARQVKAEIQLSWKVEK